MKKKLIFILLFAGFVHFIENGNVLSAAELVWIPINPSFGGSYFNASWLMSQAEAQNTFKEKVTTDRYSTSQDALENFKDSLNRQILSRLSSQLVRNAFGEDPLKEGHYEIGDYVIDIAPNNEGININIMDNATGNETNVIVPYY
ncbi:curli assembly protein CsgF [candidate division KSB1 bacterium]|nr:curli assembly protein CsgF [candidate division KSB1 bacterium]